mmetsp:Transcript_89298/g.268520  ORF Transcript_89298/g.268520 Transcript_89298/m.268520 type:complete len:337 (+) Transcript_89298:559-1569(+)
MPPSRHRLLTASGPTDLRRAAEQGAQLVAQLGGRVFGEGAGGPVLVVPCGHRVQEEPRLLHPALGGGLHHSRGVQPQQRRLLVLGLAARFLRFDERLHLREHGLGAQLLHEAVGALVSDPKVEAEVGFARVELAHEVPPEAWQPEDLAGREGRLQSARACERREAFRVGRLRVRDGEIVHLMRDGVRVEVVRLTRREEQHVLPALDLRKEVAERVVVARRAAAAVTSPHLARAERELALRHREMRARPALVAAARARPRGGFARLREPVPAKARNVRFELRGEGCLAHRTFDVRLATRRELLVEPDEGRLQIVLPQRLLRRAWEVLCCHLVVKLAE